MSSESYKPLPNYWYKALTSDGTIYVFFNTLYTVSVLLNIVTTDESKEYHVHQIGNISQYLNKTFEFV